MISSVIASLATVPYTVYHFNYFSISGIVTNLVAIPIVTLIPFGVEWIIVPLIERPINGILHITNLIIDLRYLVTPMQTFPVTSIIIVTFGLLWLRLWEQNWRFFGILFIIFGISFGFTYKTPDILVSSDNSAVKERYHLLYSLT